MKRLLLILLTVGLCILPAVAWSNTLNNNDLAITYTGPDASHNYLYASPYADSVTVYVYGDGTPLTGSFVQFPIGATTATYAAYTLITTNGKAGLYLVDSSGTSFSAFTPNGNTLTTGRIELVRTAPITLKIYQDGVLVYTHPTLSTDMWAFGSGVYVMTNPGTDGTIDDPSYGNAMGDTAIVSVMPHSWYILKDFINPASYGQKDNNGNTISTTAIHLQWSIGAQADGWSITSPPDTRYSIRVQSPTGTIVYDQPVNISTAGHAFGYVTLPFNATYIGSAPLTYGYYTVVLYDGPTIRSQDYFMCKANGATISIDKSHYNTGDIMQVTSNIAGGYYDAAHYSYSVATQNIYGAYIDTVPVTAATQITPITLSSAKYPDGAYYVTVIATSLTTPFTKYPMTYTAMDVQKLLVIGGYVMNAETGATLGSATVSISQGSISSSSLTNATGDHSYTNPSTSWLINYPMTITTNLTGYTTDINTFTPLSAKIIGINISLIPSTPTCTGICIGGLVRDNLYGNPIPAATYHVKNVVDHTATTNIAGYARVNSLVNNTLYDVWSSKTGYGNSNISQKLALGV